MTLFTPAQTKNLIELLSHVKAKGKVVTLPELHGYLFGIAPDSVTVNAVISF